MKQTNMMKLIGVVGVTTATAFIGAGEASAVVIAVDTFEVNQLLQANNETVGPETVNQSDAGLTNSIIGGTRKTTMTEENGGTRDAELFIGNRLFEITERTSQNVIINLDYNGDGQGFNNGSGLDITSNGDNTGILFEGIGNNAIDITLTLNDTSSGTATLTEIIDNSDPTNNAFFSFSRSEFTNVNLNSILNASLNVTTQGTGRSGSIEAFGFAPDINSSIPSGDPEAEAVPFEAETSVAFAFLGAFGAWKYWKRRKQQQIDFDNN